MEPSQEIGRPAFVALYGGSLNSSASEGAQVAKVNGGHKLGPDCGRQTRRFGMKIVVIGGSGLIGTKLVKNLR
jgi:hypothetical protein